MNRPTLNEAPYLWEDDGSLRDVYVHDVSETEWRALHALADRYPHEYSFEGASLPKPDPGGILANREGTHLLTIAVGEASVNCHYFIPSEIELDISPREVLTPQSRTEVLGFIEELARATRKEVSITAENSPEQVIVKFDPAANTWSVPAPSQNGT